MEPRRFISLYRMVLLLTGLHSLTGLYNVSGPRDHESRLLPQDPLGGTNS